MKKYDIVIIGGGPAGVVLAATARTEYPDRSILIIKIEGKSLVPCGIPYIFHELGDVEKNSMSLAPVVNSGCELLFDAVTNVDTANQKITVASGEEIGYDRLVFATGSAPIAPHFIDGFSESNVELISKSYSAMKQLKEQVDKAQRIIILGSGFTAVEMAEQLALEPGKEVHLVYRAKHCLHKAFSPEFSAIIDQRLKTVGVILHSESQVKKIVCNDCERKVIFDSGIAVTADIIIAALGFEANTSLAASTGLQINSNKQIVVDNYQRTSAKNVFAVGDCAQTIGFITGRIDNIMLASTATTEARILGHNLFQIRIKRDFPGTLSVFATEINKTIFASAGVLEQDARRAEISYITGSFSDIDRHPGTFSDTCELTVKLVVMPEGGQIIGGEVVGSKSSSELINIIALAIQKHVTVYELISFQIGSHPLLSGPPTKTTLIKAAENAIRKISSNKQ
ncbi:MAG: FAD-dependent oxidoreductase [Victivallaceae bacterium]